MQADCCRDATWHERLEALPDGPLLLLANEFLDALPIRQFVRRAAGWTRALRRGRRRSSSSPPASIQARGDAAAGRSNRVRRSRAGASPRELGARFARKPGAALFLDYGPADSAPGDSLQALREGRPADPLADPATADLTAHVDFAAIAAAAARPARRCTGRCRRGCSWRASGCSSAPTGWRGRNARRARPR